MEIWDNLLSGSVATLVASTILKLVKKAAEKRIQKWAKLYDTEVPATVVPPAVVEEVAARPLPPIAPLPPDLVALQREVELLRTKHELGVAQEALRDLRLVLETALLEQKQLLALREQLHETQESLRRLRRAHDEALFEHTAALAEVTAQRAYNQQLLVEMESLRNATESTHSQEVSDEGVFDTRAGGAVARGAGRAGPRLPPLGREQGARALREGQQNEGHGRTEIAGPGRDPRKR